MVDLHSAEGYGRLRLCAVAVNGKDLGFGLADVKMPVLRDAVETEDKLTEALRGLTDDGHVVGIKEDLDKLEELVGAVGHDVELAVDGVLESNTFVDAEQSLTDDVVEEEIEK